MTGFRQFVEPGSAGLTLDTAHLALGGVADVAGVIRECKDYINLFHIKDLRAGNFCPLGDGELDWGSIFEAIRDIGFDGWLVVDDESDQMSLEDALPHAMRFMREYL